MGLEFPTNLLIYGKSSSKTFLTETEDNESEFVFSSKTVSFSFLEIVQAALVAALVEVPSVLTHFLNNLKGFFLRGFKTQFFSLTR